VETLHYGDHAAQAGDLRYAAAARAAGDEVELYAPTGIEHFALIDPRSEPWQRAAAWLEARLSSAPSPRSSFAS
jgi:hypothetical protein